MQIHELDTYSGALGSGAYLAVDDGSDTGKVSVAQVLADTNTKVEQVDSELSTRIDEIIAPSGTAPNPTEITDARIGNGSVVYPNLGAAIRVPTKLLTNDVENTNKGIENFSVYGDFQNGGLFNGVLNTAYKYRVATDTIMSFDRDLFVKIESGYRIGVHYFENGVFSFDSGWQTGQEYVIRAGTSFKVIIGQNPEDTSITADVPTFVNAVTFTTIDNVAGDFVSAGGIRLHDCKWEHKAFTPQTNYGVVTPVWTSTGTFGAITTPIELPEAMKITVKTGFMFNVQRWSGSVADSDHFISHSNLLDGGRALYFEKGEYVTISIKRNDNASLSMETFIEAARFQPIQGDAYLNGVLNEIIDPALFDIGSLVVGVFYNANTYPKRIATPQSVRFNWDLSLKAESGYQFGVHTFDSTGAFVSDSGWQTNYIIPAGTLFRITIRQYPEATPDIDTYIAAVKTRAGVIADIYDRLDSAVPVFDYSAAGDSFAVHKTQYKAEKTGINATPPSSFGASSYQGFGYNNGVLFQFYSDDKVELIDYSDGSVIADLDTATGHGNAVGFLAEKYNSADEFQLAIVSDTLSSPKAYQVRITRSAVTLLRTITFPVARAGYWANAMVDALNEILYTVGYTENSWSDNSSGNNRMIFAKWDWSDLTDNGDGTVTPAFVESFTTPFMHTMQGSAYHNGKLFILSSPAANPSDTQIYVVDPIGKRISSVMTEFPADIKNIETEAVAFMDDNGETVALVKPNSTTIPYYKIRFNA